MAAATTKGTFVTFLAEKRPQFPIVLKFRSNIPPVLYLSSQLLNYLRKVREYYSRGCMLKWGETRYKCARYTSR